GLARADPLSGDRNPARKWVARRHRRDPRSRGAPGLPRRGQVQRRAPGGRGPRAARVRGAASRGPQLPARAEHLAHALAARARDPEEDGAPLGMADEELDGALRRVLADDLLDSPVLAPVLALRLHGIEAGVLERDAGAVVVRKKQEAEVVLGPLHLVPDALPVL